MRIRKIMTRNKPFVERRARRWSPMDLVTDRTTGRLRETALWSNIFKASALVAYCRFVTALNYETMTAVAGALFLAHEIGSRVLNQKADQADKNP